MASCEKKLVNQKSGLKIVAVNEVLQSPFLINEPHWVPDGECSHCTNCKIKFDFFQRRHHCRRCGRCFCGKCCSKKYPLPRMCFVDPVLHCEQCVITTTKENEFFQQQLKSLIQGAELYVTGSAFGDEAGALFNCHLTEDQRHIVLDPKERSPCHRLTVIEMKRIENTLTLSAGGSVLTGLTIRYTDPDEQPQDIQLAIASGPGNSAKQPMLWLTALQKAVKMVLESRTGVR